MYILQKKKDMLKGKIRKMFLETDNKITFEKKKKKLKEIKLVKNA